MSKRLDFKQLQDDYPYGSHWRSMTDDFEGTIVGWYITLEGKWGVDIQMDGKRIVHVYNIRWLVKSGEGSG